MSRRLVFFLHALVFVLGFSLVFVIGWGGAATLLGQLFNSYKGWLGRIGGVVVIFFGLSTLGIVRIPLLNHDTRPKWRKKESKGLLVSGGMGMFFAAGWTPCIGTTLGAILTLGFSQQTSGQAMLLSSGYALGLGLPFLAISLAMERMLLLMKRISRYMRKIQIAGAILLVMIGLLMVTDRITIIAIWAQRSGFFLDFPFGSVDAPTYLFAILAGLLSFLSPCVLPLVPAYVGYLSEHASGLVKEPTVQTPR